MNKRKRRGQKIRTDFQSQLKDQQRNSGEAQKKIEARLNKSACREVLARTRDWVNQAEFRKSFKGWVHSGVILKYEKDLTEAKSFQEEAWVRRMRQQEKIIQVNKSYFYSLQLRQIKISCCLFVLNPCKLKFLIAILKSSCFLGLM